MLTRFKKTSVSSCHITGIDIQLYETVNVNSQESSITLHSSQLTHKMSNVPRYSVSSPKVIKSLRDPKSKLSSLYPVIGGAVRFQDDLSHARGGRDMGS